MVSCKIRSEKLESYFNVWGLGGGVVENMAFSKSACRIV